MMCDKELLVSYLYDELQGQERQVFEAHLGTCSACDEVEGLRGTRAHLSSWAPVEPDLSFQIVRRSEARPSRLHWASSRGAWGLAAAAVLVLGAAAGMANVEVRSGSDGFVVRTGWSRGAVAADASGVRAANAAASRDEMAAMERRLAGLETALAARPEAGVVTTAATGDATRALEAQLLQRMRQMLAESETRTQREFAQRLIAGMSEVQASHTNDLITLQQTLNQNQGAINDEVFRQREEMKNLYRVVGTQSQR
jgi:putative zinc finger protein